MSTNVVLMFVLMGIAIVSLGALALDYRNKVRLLEDAVTRLESSQILLMVPDAQADAIAGWLISHPEQTQALLTSAKPGQQNTVTLAPQQVTAPLSNDIITGQNKAELSREMLEPAGQAHPKLPSKGMGKADVSSVISVDADGVKVIRLPSGGIRVTTREHN